MILSIKLKDNIHISREKSRNIFFGGAYFEAQDLIKDIFKIDQHTQFEFFVNSILNIFILNKTVLNKAYNLYYLANPKAIANSLLKSHLFNTNLASSNSAGIEDGLLPLVNYLNYFGFDIEKFPTVIQFFILERLKKKGIIESYWIEGKAFKPNLENPATLLHNNIPPQINVDEQEIILNEFEKDLQYSQFKNRGLGATIITVEDSATRDLSIISNYNSHLQGFDGDNFPVSFIGSFEEETELKHQLKTLVTLFSQKSEIQNNDNFQLNGICPEANLIIISVNPLEKNDYLGKIRRILVELNDSEIRNAVLLFEFVTNIFDKTDTVIPKTTLPLSVYKDINEQLVLLARAKNFIIIEGAGNMGINFDVINKLKDTIWNSNKCSYNNLSINNPDVMMIGATRKEMNGEFIFKDTNICDNFDAYMYTDFQIFGKDDLKVSFGGTSGAVALTAGIVTYLQGRAIQEMASPNLDSLIDGRKKLKKPFTVGIIKKAFENTFKKNLKIGVILTPITLENLWNECKNLALKHQ
jgi:hypothetical protein